MRAILLAGVAVLFVISITAADEPPPKKAADALAPNGADPKAPPQSAIAKQFAQIIAEFEKERAVEREFLKKAQSDRKRGDAVELPTRDLLAEYARKMVDLAETSPTEPAARDALVWVVNNPGAGETGPYSDQFARAAALLVRHFGDDPEAVRVGLTMNNARSPRGQSLLLGFYVTAKGREAKGLARFGLAHYLQLKASAVEYARKAVGRPKVKSVSGGKVVREVDLTDQEYADHLALRLCDPEATRAEALRLYEDILSEYADIPFITHGRRMREAVLKDPAPKWRGRPLTKEDRHTIEKTLAETKTLGEEVQSRLDAMRNLAIGKTAPEIEGVDIDGKAFKLSDYRGKVVALVFWGSWCGPCMAMVPHERELVERLKREPFALLGVDCEADKDTARRTMAREQMTWPSWFDGEPGKGPIATRYFITSYPSVFLIDAKGVIRSRSQLLD